jgi:signal transduction histidine kinase
MDVQGGGTEFLPSARAGAGTVRAQHEAVLGVPKLAEVLDAVRDLVVFLNQERQIVYANKAAAAFIRAHGGTPDVGTRWGEALLCEYAAANACGTKRFCRNCGAARAVLSSQSGLDETEECRITQAGGDALDFRVTTTRMSLDGNEFTVFTAVDVSDEKRREALEKTFFHDVLNTASGVRGVIELIPGASPRDRESLLKILNGLSEELIEGIVALRDLLAAENCNLLVRPARVDPRSLLLELVAAYREQDVAKGKTILFEPASSGVEMTSDPTLLRRVIGNMIKNALEATGPGEAIRVGCAPAEGWMEFWVRNPAAMPEAVRQQVFHRSFSTKGPGRGLGTYGMKLLTERYLGGTIAFTSEEGEGTRFAARFPLDQDPSRAGSA